MLGQQMQQRGSSGILHWRYKYLVQLGCISLYDSKIKRIGHLPTSTLTEVQPLRKYLYLQYIFTLTLLEEEYGISHCPARQK